jgi:O-antigen ligase/polysaccharide polymerase Wzy-like membrane protein
MSLDNPALWLFAAIVIPCALIAIKYWEASLFGVFVLAVFEGALRKWAFPWAQAQLYLVKDAILLAVYVGFLLDSQKNLPAPTGTGLIKLVLWACFAWGCIELLNPNSPSILVGLMGLKAYFLYAPIAFILPYAIKSREHLFVLIRRYLIMAIPVAVLGFIQIMAGPESSINVYVSQSEDSPEMLAYFGHDEDMFVRTSGTFSYISGYTTFLSFLAFLAIGYNMAYGWRIKNIIPILALGLIIGAMFTTGSRAPVFYLLATSPVILWLAVTRRVLSRPAAMRLCMVLPIVTILALSASPRALQAFMERTQEGSDRSEMTTRLWAPWDQTIGALSEVPAFGTGIGTTHNAALSIMGADFPWWLPILVEEEIARVTLEQGLVGLLLNYFLRILIVVFALRCLRSFKDPAYRALGIVLVVWLPQGLITSIMLNPTMGLYYWGALGLMLAMRRLEQSAGAEFGKVLVRGASQRTNLQPVMPMFGATRRWSS